jgi:Rubrerythrin
MGSLWSEMTDALAEVRERLLKAWQGEIVAGAVYDLIAQRMPDREAEILRRMAAAESGHRGRLEARMQELGIPVPDPDAVRLPLWLRLQARMAPIDRLLAAREAAEDDEVDDLYRRSTGDPVTDGLLREIRKEERSHSMAVQEIRSGSDTTDGVGGANTRRRGTRL